MTRSLRLLSVLLGANIRLTFFNCKNTQVKMLFLAFFTARYYTHMQNMCKNRILSRANHLNMMRWFLAS